MICFAKWTTTLGAVLLIASLTLGDTRPSWLDTATSIAYVTGLCALVIGALILAAKADDLL
jgi:hypothetical protein